MFCPQCKAEYRQGFCRCADCDVDLVDELRVKQVPAASASVDDGVRVLWRGISQDSCVSVCLELRNKGIPYQVAEFPTTSALRLNSSRRYVLAVSSDDYERAKAAVGLDEDPPAAFSEEQWTEMENPEDPDQPEDPAQDALGLDDGDGGQSFSDQFTRELQERRDVYTRPWFPEDATSEIWSQAGENDFSGAIEMTLKEHFIHCRIDREDGQGRVFVVPRDEGCTLQIVREMVDNAPTAGASGGGFQFCPLCIAEYRPGFGECSECRVALLPTQAEALSASTRLWTGESDRTLDRILAVLDAHDIPAHYKQQAVPRAQVTILGFTIGKQPFEYSVRVFRSDLERARAAMADVLNPDT
jgi:hypothetical protein